MFATIKNYFAHLLEVPEAVSPARYRSLRRLMTVLMVAVSVTPLLLLSAISHVQYMRTLERELESPVYAWPANRRRRWNCTLASVFPR